MSSIIITPIVPIERGFFLAVRAVPVSFFHSIYSLEIKIKILNSGQLIIQLYSGNLIEGDGRKANKMGPC